MNPELTGFLDQIDAVKRDGPAVCAGLTASQFNWRPGEKRWSIAECLVHLNVSVTRTFPNFDAAIERGRSEGRTAAPGATFRYGWFSRLMIASMEPPPRFRMRTMPIFDVPPASTYTLATVLEEFRAVRDGIAERVRRADGLDVARIRVTSPANRLLRVPLGAYVRFILAHDRRHVWQARQVRSAMSASGQI